MLSIRPIRPAARDITKLSNAISNHDCGNLARVVMVRKTDQRVINHKNQKVFLISNILENFFLRILSFDFLFASHLFRIIRKSKRLQWRQFKHTRVTSQIELL
jgi:hypothetical protein